MYILIAQIACLLKKNNIDQEREYKKSILIKVLNIDGLKAITCREMKPKKRTVNLANVF
ncbi:hypothetical protein J6590_083410 [Homalodisca vitripennis]|nr:hypothetical protein J6590_083410 [Homalodisca vitripennis]